MLTIFAAKDAIVQCSSEKAQLSLDDIVFVVLSQPNTYHIDRAKAFKQEWQKEVNKLSKRSSPVLYFSHKKWKAGGWTMLPILKDLAEQQAERSWVFICEEETRFHLGLLLENLQQYDPKQKIYLGQALYDTSATIIHHFAFHDDPGKFRYPDTAAGVAFSTGLLRGIDRWTFMEANFHVDAKHELAMFLYDDGRGTELDGVDFLCAGRDTSRCATTYTALHFPPQCGDPVAVEDLFVAVKTCEKYHRERVPVVQQTWGKETRNLEYYSEVADPAIPTVDLGVPNTDIGHCAKTRAIIKRAATHPEIRNKKWLLIADDDTIISLSRLRGLLSCYDAEEKVALGERYGYAVATSYGYDYITGGGGMVLSLALVRVMASVEGCECPRPESPDDMILGTCLRRMGVPVTHSPLFHQARPDDYAAGYLSHQRPVSFHKHWMNDPLQVYREWFHEDVVDGSGKKDEL